MLCQSVSYSVVGKLMKYSYRRVLYLSWTNKHRAKMNISFKCSASISATTGDDLAYIQSFLEMFPADR